MEEAGFGCVGRLGVLWASPPAVWCGEGCLWGSPSPFPSKSLEASLDGRQTPSPQLGSRVTSQPPGMSHCPPKCDFLLFLHFCHSSYLWCSGREVPRELTPSPEGPPAYHLHAFSLGLTRV